MLLCLTVSGAWAQTYTKTVNINEAGGDVVVTANEHWLITGTGAVTANKIKILENATVTLSGVNIETNNETEDYSCIQCVRNSNATIILADETTNILTSEVKWCAAIQVGFESTLTIQGTGKLEATGGTYGAGIGSDGSNTCGNIVIEGGNITAKGGKYAAGIGASNFGSCGNITISGGTVDATAGSNAAGIGGGKGQTSTNNGYCGNITINGGVVSVTDNGAACIGSGQNSTCGAITITDGTFTLTNSNTYTHGFIGGNYVTVTIDGVANANEESKFSHFESEVTSTPSGSTTWKLTRNLYEVTANLADGAYWSTFYSESGHYKAPEGTQVFAVNLNGEEITMTEITDRIVKIGEGVVLKQATESSDATTTIAMTLAMEFTSNFSTYSLKGTTISIPNPGNAYVLGKTEKEGVGFYKLSSGVTIGANKAYLTYDGPVSARGFFGFSDATGIEMPTVESNDDADAVVYDLQGRRVSQPVKGLYILNGKKVIIK